MKRMLIAAAFVAASTPAAAAERRYMLIDFDRVQVTGPFEVALTTGRPSSGVAIGSQAALDRVSVEVQGRTLHVRPNRSAWGGYPVQSIGRVRIEVATRDLRAAAVAGAGNLVIDRAKGLRLDLSVSGSGRIGIAGVDADLIVVSLNGSGKVVLGGKSKQLRASVQGSGDLEAPSFRADDVDIAAGTSGTIRVTAARTAKIRAVGTGEVEIAGSPACTVTGLGAGGVRCGTGRSE